MVKVKSEPLVGGVVVTGDHLPVDPRGVETVGVIEDDLISLFGVSNRPGHVEVGNDKVAVGAAVVQNLRSRRTLLT